MISLAQKTGDPNARNDMTQSDLASARYDAKLKANCAEGARNGRPRAANNSVLTFQ